MCQYYLSFTLWPYLYFLFCHFFRSFFISLFFFLSFSLSFFSSTLIPFFISLTPILFIIFLSLFPCLSLCLFVCPYFLFLLFLSLSLAFSLFKYTHTHTYTHTHIYIYVCVCVCLRFSLSPSLSFFFLSLYSYLIVSFSIFLAFLVCTSIFPSFVLSLSSSLPFNNVCVNLRISQYTEINWSLIFLFVMLTITSLYQIVDFNSIIVIIISNFIPERKLFWKIFPRTLGQSYKNFTAVEYKTTYVNILAYFAQFQPKRSSSF